VVPSGEVPPLRIHDEASRVRDFQRSPVAALDDLALAAYLQWSRVCVLHSSRGLVAAVRHDPVLAEFQHSGQVWLQTDEEQCSQLKQPVPSSRPVVSPLAAGWHGPVLAESRHLRGAGPPADAEQFLPSQQRLAFARPVVSLVAAGHCEEECPARVVTSPRLSLMA